jgi:Undecaprenyl-phosphate glucose phosphotransferase
MQQMAARRVGRRSFSFLWTPAMNAPFHDPLRTLSAEARELSATAGTPMLSPDLLPGLAQFVDALALLAIGWFSLLSHVSHTSKEWRFGVLVVALGTILATRVLKALDAYEFDSLEHWPTGVARSTIGLCLTFGALCCTLWLIGSSIGPTYGWLKPWILGSLMAMAATRLAYLFFIMRWRSRGGLERRVAVVGSGRVAQSLLSALADDPDVVITGVYDDLECDASGTCAGHAVRGSLDDLIDHCRKDGTTSICVALPLSQERRIATILERLVVVPADVRLCPDAYGVGLGPMAVSHLGNVTLLNVRDLPLGGWRLVIKEIEDRLIAAAVLALVAPLFAIIAIAIRLDSPGPVFFRQMRHGYNNRLIRVLKFRTLYDHASDPNAEKLSDDEDPRVTRVGAVLRRTMLDELPQFVNVLRGEMSVVGPRPHAMAAKAGGLLYRDAVPDYDARHRMKPGVTGWAQVNGWRGDTKTVEQIRQRVAHDLHYIEHWSVMMDLKIVIMTALMALRALSFTSREARRHAMPLADAGRSGPSS